MKKIFLEIRYFFIPVILFFIQSHGFAQGKAQWLKNPTSYLGDDYGYAVYADPFGAVYSVGSFNDTIVFSGQTLISQSGALGYDGFIFKYDSLGNEIWGKRISSFRNQAQIYCIGIDGDSLGNIYVLGEFTDTAHFGPFVLKAFSSTDGFLCKLDSGGNFKWAFQMAGGSFDYPRDLKVDTDGSIYITGSYAYNLKFGSIFLNGYTGKDIFVGKVDRNGNALWIHRAGCYGTGNTHDEGFGIDIDSHGNCYTTGWFRDTSDFDTIKLIAKGDYDIFVAKYSPIGDLIWARRAGGFSNFSGNSAVGIALKNDSAIFVNGTTVNGADFGNLIFHTSFGNATFMAEIDSAGNFKRVAEVPNCYPSSWNIGMGKRLLANPKGETYFIAHSNYVPIGYYGIRTLSAIVKLDSLLRISWVKPLYDIGGIYKRNGKIYFTGYYGGQGNIDGFNLIANGLDVLTGKLNDATNKISGFVFEDVDGDSLHTVFDIPIVSDSIYLKQFDLYLVSDSTGFWQATIDTGLYDLINVVPNGFTQIKPINPASYSISFSSFNQTTSNLNFALAKQTVILENQHESHSQIFPNPLISSSTLNFSTHLKDAELIIYDMLGKEMIRKRFSGNEIKIEKGNLQSGVYFVKVTSDERQWMQKIIVE